MFKWWGYRHLDGSIQAKRFFDERDIMEAKESDLVGQVVGPFLVENREEALEMVKSRT